MIKNIDMKRFLLIVTAVVAVVLAGCTNDGSKYKEMGETMAQQLDELCQKQDSAAVLEFEKTLNAQEEEIVATGDSVAIKAFREALKEARERNAPYITSIKVQQGVDKDAAVKDVIDDVLDGKMSIQAVTASVDTLLTKEKPKK